MNQQVETMKLALEALEETRNALAWFYDSYPQDVTKKGNKLLPHVETVLTTLREALAQPQQEPSGWQKIVECPICGDMAIATGIPAAQRKPLTDEELYKVFPAIATYTEANKTLYRSIARAIEAAHGIKENT